MPGTEGLQPLQMEPAASWSAHPGAAFTLDEDEEPLLVPQPPSAFAAAGGGGSGGGSGRPPLQRGVSNFQLRSELEEDSWASYRHEAGR